MPECTEQHAAFFRTLDIDLWKDGISLPSLAMSHLFRTLKGDDCFALVDKRNADFYWKLRGGTQGGLSIVINRLMMAGKTMIREGPNGKLCACVMSLDANSLYLGTLTMPMPVQHFCTYKPPSYRREKSFESGIAAYEWFKCYERQNNVSVRHKFNHKSEFRVLGIGVDGYVKETNTVLQYQGCLFHGCDKCSIAYKWMPDGGLRTHNPINGKSFKELRDLTEKRSQAIRQVGFNLIEKWEHDWRVERHLPSNKSILDDTFYTTKYHPEGPMTKDRLVELIRTNKIFGFGEVSMHCPEEKRKYFEDFQPFYKNAEVGIDDIGPHMQEFALKNDLLKKPIKCLLLSYTTEKAMLLTPLIQWYLEKGCIVDEIHTFYSFKPSVCFTEFVDNITKARRDGDKFEHKKVISELSKYLGNASIGKSLLQKERHRRTYLADEKRAGILVNSPRFDALEEVYDDVYEISMRKKSIRHNVPLTLGCVVYSYSKLWMLTFIYDFLYKYFSKDDLCLLNSDTDSIWIGMSKETLDEIVRPDLAKEYYTNFHRFMPALACMKHREEFVATKLAKQCWDMESRPCCVEHNKHEQRTPMLFKYEYVGDYLVATNCKTYHAGRYADNLKKQSSKGVSKLHSQLNKDDYLTVLTSGQPKNGVNLSFMVRDSNIFTYKQERVGLSYLYYKRIVDSDGCRTQPTNI